MAELPFTFSQVPGNPSFRDSAVNAVAVVPLLSSNKDGEIATTHSAQSFDNLMAALQQRQQLRAGKCSSSKEEEEKADNILLVVPNSSLTRPGDWRYPDTPLKSFSWQHGCQRLRLFDGRPQTTRLAHDRLINHTVTRDWIDLCPSRRTAAVVGVLNMHDCKDLADLHRAEEELHQWANRYATPPYEVTAHGSSLERDKPVERLFVFDSFDEECQKIDLSKCQMGNSILAFPPVDEAHAHLMDLHLNVVVNDLAVAIFRSLESRIIESDAIGNNLMSSSASAASASQRSPQASSTARRSFTSYLSGSSIDGKEEDEEQPISPSKMLSLSQMASFVNPDSRLGKESSPKGSAQASGMSSSFAAELRSSAGSKGSSSGTTTAATSTTPKLLTPLDDFWNQSALSSRDMEAIRKRDMARREKLAADLSLLAGSPSDAYGRYLKAAEMCKSGTPDPLWYASSLQGMAATHIAFAEAGGFGVDLYLEENFEMPDEIMQLAKSDEAIKKSSTSKQTLPEVVQALCEEALNITNRHPKLGAFHAELLLKFASYLSESAEAHFRCRWGEGEGCYPGEVDDVPRWEKPSVYKLKLGDLKIKDGSVSVMTFNRVRAVCSLLHEAASVGSLDPSTRVDVAARCARICLDGVKASQYRSTVTEWVKLPRKAAFFATVAAEAVTSTRSDKTSQTARDLWSLATQLYSKESNMPDGGIYGWAALRAISLNALSLQGTSPLSHEAAEELLALLSEISPPLPEAETQKAIPNQRMQQTDRYAAEASPIRPASDRPIRPASDHGSVKGMTTPERGSKDASTEVETDRAAKVSTFAKQLRESFTTMTGNVSIVTMESKWADDAVIPPVNVPFALSSSAFPSVQTLGCVWQNIDFEKSSVAQARCMDRIVMLRRALATSSAAENQKSAAVENITMPLYVSSAAAIHVQPTLALERIKREKKKFDNDAQDAMATFFNPFDNKRSSKSQMTIVAEEEERAMSVKFGNRLSRPLEVQRCQLEFKNDVEGRVKATALSFIVPAQATGFAVNFPFTVLSTPTQPEDESRDSTIFEVKGINLTFFGRTLFLPIHSEGRAVGTIPRPASIYPHLPSYKGKSESEQHANQRFETCPSQPRLQIFFEESGAPVGMERPIPISLTDGELFTIPSLRLKNFPGPSGHGKVERLQIFAVDLPSISDRKLFDRKLFDSEMKASDSETEKDFVRQLIDDQSPPPLKLRVLASSLNLDEVNEGHDSSSSVSIQIAAAHNMEKQLPEGATVRIRFRYRGHPTATTEFWRKREITLRVTCIKGPRISSMDFRPDLATESAYVEMCQSLHRRNRKTIADSVDSDAGIDVSHIEKESDVDVSQINVSQIGDISHTKDSKGDISHIKEENSAPILNRVGMDSGIHVASEDVLFVLTIANETTSEVTLSREDGPVGGFRHSPLKIIHVHSGVSAKLPFVIPRIPRVKEDGSPVDIVEEVVSRTSLIWESQREAGSDMARGHIRIPPGALKEIVNQHPLFVSRMCEPPCQVQLMVGKSKVSSSSPTTIPLGSAVDLQAEVSVAAWVPKDVSDGCKLILEFFCARKDHSVHVGSNQPLRDYLWCGKLRENFRMSDNEKSHRARIVFVNGGTYKVSACARISHDISRENVEEIWWAPVAATFTVDNTTAAQ